MSSFPVSRQHFPPASPHPPKHVSVSACTVRCSHHQLATPAVLPHGHIHLLQLDLPSELRSFHPQSHCFQKCLPVFLQSPCWLLCLTLLSSCFCFFYFCFFFFLWSVSCVWLLPPLHLKWKTSFPHCLMGLPNTRWDLGQQFQRPFFGMAHRSPEVNFRRNLYQPSQMCRRWAGFSSFQL